MGEYTLVIDTDTSGDSYAAVIYKNGEDVWSSDGYSSQSEVYDDLRSLRDMFNGISII